MQSCARDISRLKLLIPMLLILALLAPDAMRSPAYAQLTASQALVTDRPSGTCHIVDATTGAIVTTFACGAGAEGVDVNSIGTRAVVGSCLLSTEPDHLRLFDLTTTPPTLLGTILAGVSCVEEVDIAPNDQFGIAPGSADGRVSKFTLSPFMVTGTSTPLGTGTRGGSPQDVHIDATSTRAVLPMFDNQSLRIIDITGATPVSVATIPTPDVQHHGITLSEGNNDTILASRLFGGITVASRSDAAVIATILTTATSEAIDITCDGRRAVAETSGGLAWIDMTTSPPAVLSSNFGLARTDGISTSSVAFNADGSRLFVGGGNKIDIYNATSDPPTLLSSITEIPNFNVATRPCRVLTANNDAFSTNEDTDLSIAAPGVLANDTGNGLTAELVADAEHGSVTLNANGSFTYVPNPNFNGLDSFVYVAKQGGTESNIATVMITVVAVNDPPFFNPIPDQFGNPPLNENQTVDITALRPGPVDESGQTLTLAAVSSNTALISNPTFTGEGSTRSLIYKRVGNGSGTATITVTAQDNGGTDFGGANTFSRTFDITVGATIPTSVVAAVTGFSPNPDNTKAPTVEVTITVRPIDFNGNGLIDVPGDCFLFFPPRPAPQQPHNVFPSNANQVPEGPPWRIPEDTEEICDVTKTFTGVLDLSEWITTGGTRTIDIFYVSIVRDPELSPDGQCPAGAVCSKRLWTGIRPVGSLTFTPGDGATVADVNKVTLHTTDTVLGATSDAPLPGVIARVYDRNDSAFQNQRLGGQRVGKNPDGSLYDDIFESTVGRISTCTTNESGVCIATEAQPGVYLVIVKFIDRVQNLVVYEGSPKGLSDFVNGVATKSFTILKKLRNGAFQEYHGGSKTTVVKPCTPTICP